MEWDVTIEFGKEKDIGAFCSLGRSKGIRVRSRVIVAVLEKHRGVDPWESLVSLRRVWQRKLAAVRAWTELARISGDKAPPYPLFVAALATCFRRSSRLPQPLGIRYWDRGGNRSLAFRPGKLTRVVFPVFLLSVWDDIVLRRSFRKRNSKIEILNRLIQFFFFSDWTFPFAILKFFRDS